MKDLGEVISFEDIMNLSRDSFFYVLENKAVNLGDLIEASNDNITYRGYFLFADKESIDLHFDDVLAPFSEDFREAIDTSIRELNLDNQGNEDYSPISPEHIKTIDLNFPLSFFTNYRVVHSNSYN